MRPPVLLHQVESSYEAKKIGLDAFAKSFDHELRPIFPMLVATIGDEIRAYAHIDLRALVTCAIHPERNSPRDTLNLAKATLDFLSQTRPGFLMNAPGESGTLFTDKAMGTLGLRPWPNRIFHVGAEW